MLIQIFRPFLSTKYALLPSNKWKGTTIRRNIPTELEEKDTKIVVLRKEKDY